MTGKSAGPLFPVREVPIPERLGVESRGRIEAAEKGRHSVIGPDGKTVFPGRGLCSQEGVFLHETVDVPKGQKGPDAEHTPRRPRLEGVPDDKGVFLLQKNDFLSQPAPVEPVSE